MKEFHTKLNESNYFIEMKKISIFQIIMEINFE